MGSLDAAAVTGWGRDLLISIEIGGSGDLFGENVSRAQRMEVVFSHLKLNKGIIRSDLR